MSDNKKRVLASIDRVYYETNDHGILTVDLSCNAGGYTQSFGGLNLNGDGLADDYIQDLLSTFNISSNDINDLQGKICFLLYSFSGWNQTIAGIESVDTGKRFLNYGWRKKHRRETKDPLQEKQETILLQIESAKQTIKRLTEEYASLSDDYTDWIYDEKGLIRPEFFTTLIAQRAGKSK